MAVPMARLGNARVGAGSDSVGMPSCCSKRGKQRSALCSLEHHEKRPPTSAGKKGTTSPPKLPKKPYANHQWKAYLGNSTYMSVWIVTCFRHYRVPHPKLNDHIFKERALDWNQSGAFSGCGVTS